MTDKQDFNNPIDPLMDTQRLLLGVELPEDGTFDLDEILAEYGSKPAPAADAPRPEEPPPPPEPEPEAEPEPEPEPAPTDPPDQEEPARPARRRWRLFRRREPEPDAAGETEDSIEEEVPPDPPPIPAPPAPPEIKPENPQEASGISEEDLMDQAFWEDLGLRAEVLQDAAPETEAVPDTEAVPEPQEEAPPPPEREPEPEPEPEPAQEEPPPVSMEDVVASTVDAVKEEQEQHQEKLRRRLEKLRRKKTDRTVRRREPTPQPPLPETENEPLPSELAGWHKRRFRECRRALLLSVPLLALLWAPWVLDQFGVSVPFFSASADNAAVSVLVIQTLISILCWPVYRAAVEGLRERCWNVCATALLCTAVTLLDEMTMLLLPERAGTPPLGGIAAALSVFVLWGLNGLHRGMIETMRTAAMGAPTRLVDRCENGIAKGAGGIAGFCTRSGMEDTSSQWQRLLLPLLAAASLVFGVLSSVGQERNQDLLWCWSVVLCASSSLVFPLAFWVPFGRLAERLSRNGAAVAGHYGAAALASSTRLVVTDGDLFPPGAAVVGGLKLYGEERERAVSYAATLAVQGGGILGRMFGELARSGSVDCQTLEHFHIHDDSGGMSGMIHGETVLVGVPSFMRHKAVRLPASLPYKTCICLAVDGELTAVFSIKYRAADTTEIAIRALRRNGFQLVLAVRDGNVTPKLLKGKFGTDCSAVQPEMSERLSLSDPEREAGGPNGLLYREGLLPYASLVAGSRRLCQTAAVGNLISIFSSIAGALLGFYLTFTGSYGVLTPLLLLIFLLLWTAPMLPLVWTVDKL